MRSKSNPNPTYRPLFDTVEGGPVRAFECLASIPAYIRLSDGVRGHYKACGRVVATRVGMMRHLWRVHGIRMQYELFEPAQVDAREQEMLVPTRCEETGRLNAVRTHRSLGDETSKGCGPDGGTTSRSQQVTSEDYQGELPKSDDVRPLAQGHEATDNGIEISNIRSVPLR